MPKPNVEYEICLSGKIEISDLENLEILNNVQKKYWTITPSTLTMTIYIF